MTLLTSAPIAERVIGRNVRVLDGAQRGAAPDDGRGRVDRACAATAGGGCSASTSTCATAAAVSSTAAVAATATTTTATSRCQQGQGARCDGPLHTPILFVLGIDFGIGDLALVVRGFGGREVGLLGVAAAAAARRSSLRVMLAIVDHDRLVGGFLVVLAGFLVPGVVLVVARDFLGTHREVGFRRDVDLLDLLEYAGQWQLAVGELQRGLRRAHRAHGAVADDDAVAVAQDQHQVNVQRADILDVLDGDVLEVGVCIGQLQDGNGHGGTPYKVTSRYLRHARHRRNTQAPIRTRNVPDDRTPDRRAMRGDLVGRKSCSVTNACHSDGAHLS